MLLIEFEFRYFFIHCFKVITFLKFSRIHDRVYSASVRLLTRLDQMNQKDPKMMKKLILNDSIFILSFIKNPKPKFLQTYLVHKTKIVLKLGMPVGDIYCLWNTLRMLVVFNFDIFFQNNKRYRMIICNWGTTASLVTIIAYPPTEILH